MGRLDRAKHPGFDPLSGDAGTPAEYQDFHQHRFDLSIQEVAPRLARGQTIGIVGVSPFDEQLRKAFPDVQFCSIVPASTAAGAVGLATLPPEMIVTADLGHEELRPPRQFHGVLFMEVLEHLPYPDRRVLHNLARMLLPGGWLLLTVPNVASFRNRLRFLMGTNLYWDKERILNGAFGGWGHIREYTFSEVLRLLPPWFHADVVKPINGYRRGPARVLNILPREFGNTILVLATVRGADPELQAAAPPLETGPAARPSPLRDPVGPE